MFRISKRPDLPLIQQSLIRGTGILAALIIMSFFFAALGHNPIKVYLAMINGSLGTMHRFIKTVELMVPLCLTALGILVAFKMKFWNIGAEGQILVGALASTFVALNFGSLPRPLLLSAMFLAGMVAGGLWALIPAFFKVNFATNETLFTLMLNYIALKWVIYLQYGPWRDPAASGFPKIANIPLAARLPEIGGIHIGWLILLVAIALMYIMMNYTKLGYEIAVVGESQNTARYAGMDVKKIILLALFISGAFSGLVGMIQVAGVNRTLSAHITGGIGYTAIIVTWLSQVNVQLIPVIGLLFAILVQGATFIQTAFQIPQSVASILQGMILFFALGSEFFIAYQIHWVKKSVRKEVHND